jgi:hypothetical protein
MGPHTKQPKKAEKSSSSLKKKDGTLPVFPQSCTMCQKITPTTVASVVEGSYATSGIYQTFSGSVNGSPAVHINFEPFSIIRCPGKSDVHSGMFFHVYIIINTNNTISGNNVYDFYHEPGVLYLDLFKEILRRNQNFLSSTNIDTIYTMMKTKDQINSLSFIILNKPIASEDDIFITDFHQLGTIENLARCKESNGGSRKKKSIRRRNKTSRRRC